PAERAAYVFARRFTYEPHHLGDADIVALRKHYKELQILEMLLSMAGNNAINRWKEGVGVPQSRNGGGFGRRGENPPPPDAPLPSHSYLTPTSEAFKNKISKVAPLQIDVKTGKPCRLTVCARPGLEAPADVERALETCRTRTPRLPLVEEAKARELLAGTWPPEPLPQWVRLLANFPKDGKSRILSQQNAEEKGNLKPL